MLADIRGIFLFPFLPELGLVFLPFQVKLAIGSDGIDDGAVRIAVGNIVQAMIEGKGSVFFPDDRGALAFLYRLSADGKELLHERICSKIADV